MKAATLSLFTLDATQFALRLSGEQTRVYFISTALPRTVLKPLFTTTESNYQAFAPDLKQQGQELLAWFNLHPQGHLATLRQPKQALALRIAIQVGANDLGLRHLPWELLHNGVQFWCTDGIHLFTPIRLASDYQHIDAS